MVARSCAAFFLLSLFGIFCRACLVQDETHDTSFYLRYNLAQSISHTLQVELYDLCNQEPSRIVLDALIPIHLFAGWRNLRMILDLTFMLFHVARTQCPHSFNFFQSFSRITVKLFIRGYLLACFLHCRLWLGSDMIWCSHTSLINTYVADYCCHQHHWCWCLFSQQYHTHTHMMNIARLTTSNRECKSTAAPLLLRYCGYMAAKVW